MKVTHLISGSEGGGSRFQVLSLLEELHFRSSVEVELLSLMEGPLTEDARSRGLPLELFSMKSIWDFSVLKPLLRYLGSSGPDILHTHGVRANFIGRLIYKFMADDLKPVLFTTVHSSIYHDYQNSWKRFIYPPLEKGFRGDVSQFIAVSQGLYRELKSDGVSEKRLAMIPNGIYPEKFSEARDKHVVISESSDLPSGDSVTSLRYELNIPEQAWVILSVGRLVPVKGHSYLLSAFSQFLQQSDYKDSEDKWERDDVYLVLVGNGPEEDRLKRQAEELSISHRVVFAGYRKDVPAFLQMADLFVLPSHMEGMPIILLEAMAAGIPLVAAEVGGIPEVISDGETGVLVPTADAESLAETLADLWASPNHLTKLAENAQNKVRQDYHFSRVVEETEKLYHAAINNQL